MLRIRFRPCLLFLLPILVLASAAPLGADEPAKPAPASENPDVSKKKKKKSAAPKRHTGYTDTPFIPGQRWRVHDDTRPRPPIVTPGETFSHAAAPPSDATVLFDGTNLDRWEQLDGSEPGWKVENGYVECVPKSGHIRTKDQFGDFQLHIEFATPARVESNSQGRGNSGVIIYGQYEVQVLDSYENKSYADGQAGALYGQFPPRRNASKPPGRWQTYDIIFETARWDGEKLVKPSHVTVLHNGVVLHHRQEYLGASAHRRAPKYTPHPPRGHVVLQDHGNTIRYRNIWIRPLGQYDEGGSPKSE